MQEIFDDQGLEMGDEIIIRREILQNGRSISRVNGQMVNLSVLRAIGQHLVDIHGQHDQEELCVPNCIFKCWMNLVIQALGLERNLSNEF